MKLLNYGGATAILEHKGKRMLFDPWLDDGIYNGSWYHYPPLKIGIPDLGRLDYVYISHIHEDHCSAGTIKHINKDAEIIIIDREPNFVKRFLDLYEFKFKKVHLIKPYTPTPIADGLIVDMVEADPEHDLNVMIDSGLVLNWDGFVVYNGNDCAPHKAGLEHILKAHKKVDLAMMYYAGGSAYPPCYTNLTHEQKLAEKARIHKRGLDIFCDAVKTLQPRWAMPFADQYVIAGSRSPLNSYLPHPPDGSAVLEPLRRLGLESKALLLNSGQAFDFDAGKKVPDEPYRVHTEADKETYIREKLLDKRYDHEAFVLDRRVPLERLVALARAYLWKQQQRGKYFPAFRYYLDVPDRKLRFEIALDRELHTEVAWDAPLVEPYLRMSASSTLLALLLIGHVSWNLADAGLFIDYERVPNVYDPKIHAFVNHIRI